MNKPLILILLPFALLGCAKPEITVEPAAAPEGSRPVGVLEFGKAHSGSGGRLGISLGETLGESAYCAATVLDNGLIATSADCLQDEKNSYEVKEMRFHLRAPGSETTKHYTVKAVQSVDAPRNLAYLALQEIPEVLVRTSIPSHWDAPSVKEADAVLAPSLTGTALTVSDPDKKGVVHIAAAPVRIETESVPVPLPVSDKAESDEMDASGNPEAPAAAAAAPESPFAHPRTVSIVGLKTGNRGSPIFVNGQLVGILRGDPSLRNNGHWLVGPASR